MTGLAINNTQDLIVEDIRLPKASSACQLRDNSDALECEMLWFSQVLEARIALYFINECEYASVEDVSPPDFSDHRGEYARLVRLYQMSPNERIVLILAIIPHLRPQLLNILLTQDQTIGKPYVEFGGWQGKTHTGFLPTCETATYIIAGDDIGKRLEVFGLFKAEHFLNRDGLIHIVGSAFDESYLAAPLTLNHEYFNRVTMGKVEKPDFSMHFPAKLIETNLEWSDLVLPLKVLSDVDHIHTWLKYQQFILHGMGLDKSINPGYRSLFYGPPGTGKTLTASLLGKSIGMDVYRIDISSVVSKFIGETEKNLEAIFTAAENRQWILFFDEADALFGKRTETSSSNDRHANQEVAYLLQRIESFPGVVILATNFKANIDDAFIRRFQSMIYFPMPGADQREELWEKALGNSPNIAESVDIKSIAAEHEMAGGSIINVIRYAAITALRSNRTCIEHQDILLGISKEKRKHGSMM